MQANENIHNKWLELATVSIGSFMFSMDNTSLTITFPSLIKVFQTEISVVLWVTVAYLLVSTALLLIFGRLGDLFGRKRIYVLGFTIFTVGLVFCSISQSVIQLILSRVIQGIGAGMILSVLTAIVTASFPDHERGKAMGVLEAVISAGVLVGPVMAGFLLDTLDWRAVFYIRVPVGIIGVLMAIILLKEQKSATDRPSVDYIGAGTLFIGILCLLLFLNIGDRIGFVSVLALGLLCAGIFLLVFFVLQEKRTVEPVVDLRLFRNALFTGCNLSFGIMSFALAALLFLTPFFLIDGVGFTATESGMLIIISSVMSFIAGPLAGWLSDRIGTRLLRPVGMALLCLSFIMFSRLGGNTVAIDVIFAFAVFGIGIGIFNPTTESSIMGSIPRERLGTAAGMMNTIRQVGISAGTAVIGVVYANRKAFHTIFCFNIETCQAEQLAIIGGYQDSLLFAAFVLGIGIIVTLIGGKTRPRS